MKSETTQHLIFRALKWPKTALLALATIAAVAIPARAASVSYTTNVPVTATTFVTTAQVQSFDPSLGTLTGVSLTLNASFTVTLKVFNSTGIVEGYSNAIATGSATVTGTGLNPLNVTFSSGTVAQANAALASHVTDTYPGLTATATSTSNPADLADYIGGAGVFETMNFQGGPLTAGGTQPGGIVFNASGTASGSIQITYTYTPAPLLSIAKTPTTATVGDGGTGTFALTVTNAGTAPTTASVTVTDPVPANLTVTTAPNGTGWDCSASLGQNVNCTRNDVLNAGIAFPAINVGYTVATGVASPYTNTATVTGGGDPTAPHTSSANVIVPPLLSILKTPATATVAQGGTGTFTLAVSNTAGWGPTTAAVTVTDPVPANLTVTTAPSGTGWDCSASAGQNVSCTRNTVLAPGASYPAITVGYTVATGVASPYTNTATVNGGGDPTAPHTSSATVTVPPLLSILKTPATATVAQGGTGTFTLAVSNSATAGPTSAAVTVTDPVPANLTVTTAPTGTGWDCSASAGQNVSCTRNTVLAPGASYPAITLGYTTTATAATGSPYTNTATVNGGGDPTAPHTSSANVIVPAPSAPPPVAVPDLTVTKSHTGNFTQGQQGATYTLVVSNILPTQTTGTVSINDTLPAGLTFVSMSGTGWNCIAGVPSCFRNDVLGGNASYPPITVTVNVSPTASGTLVNAAVVSGGGENNTTNDTAVDPTILSGIPDMTIAKTHTGTNFSQGGSVTFTLTASNVGTSATSGAAVTVSDILPTGLTATAISGAAPWVCQPIPALSCTRSDILAVGASYSPISVTASIGANATGTLVNNAQVGGGGEVNLTNDTATDSIALNGVPDMTITKTHAGTNFTQGGSVTFALTASNVGNAATSGIVTVTDILPAGLTATAVSGASPWVCQPLPALSCSRGDTLGVNAAYSPITVTAAIAANATGTLVNNAQVGGGGEVNLANDTATDSILVNGVPDMTITKTHAGTTFNPGGSVTFSLTANNIGSASTNGTVTVTDTLPAGLKATAISGAAPWVCQALPVLSCSRSDVLASGASYSPISVTATIAAGVSGTLVNNAQVGGGGEVNLPNDYATDSIVVTGSCQPTLTKTNNGNFLPGGTGTYTMVVSNTGTAPTFGNTSVSDPMPQGLTATAISGTGWTCSLSPLANCTRGDALAPGGSYPPITLAVNIASNAPSTINNVATAICDCDPVPAVPITATSGVILSVDLSTFRLTKSANQSQAQIGDVVEYTVQVVNGSTSPFTNAQVKDMEPAGFLYVSGSAQLAMGSGAPQPVTPITTTPGILIFPLGTLAAQQTDTLTYRLQVGGKARLGPNVNNAQGTGTEPNGSPASTNQAQAVVNIEAALFSTRQFLIGHVFEDLNGNGEFDEGEPPVAGARVYLSNGASATTDSNGLYNIPVVAPGSVVVELDAATVPKGYTLSSGDRLDAQSWSRLVRTPLNEGMMLRQNFGLKKCPYCQATTVAPTAAAAVALSSRPAAKLELIPMQPSLPGDGRTAMKVRVRVLDDQGNPTKAAEVRIRTSAGEVTKEAGANAPTPSLLGKHTELQGGTAIEQVPQTMQAGIAKSVEGETTFLLIAAHTAGEAQLVAESGDPDHLLSAEASVWFTPEKRSPILVSDGEISVGRAAPEFPILGQSGNVSRRGDAYLQTPLSGGYLMMTLGYTSHLTLNDSNGNPGLFQIDPQNRIYPVYGDSSTQYYAAQSNAHAYGRLEHEQSYLLFGDLRMSSSPVSGAPVPAGDAFSPTQPVPQQAAYGVGDYNRNVVGAALHLEDGHHDFITVEGARPNTAFSRDVFPGSTFGLIQLSHTNVLPGSESGVLETRDVHNPEIVLAREQLVRSVDYTIDPYTGAIFFLRTLNAYDQALNLNQVVFTYEYQNVGGVSSVYGVRTQLRADGVGFRMGLGVTEQRDPVAGSYYLGDFTLQQRLPNNGRLSLEVPVSHGTALSAGLTTGGTANVNGTAIRGDLDQPFSFLSGRMQSSFSKTDSGFFNPFGATTIPGALTLRESVEVKPLKKTTIKIGFTGERNKTSLVDNQRQTGSFEWRQFLTGRISLTAGYDYRDFKDTLNVKQVTSNEVAAGIEWKPLKRFTASVRREENLTASDPTYPNETLVSARYQATETVRLFATERLASAPITPIGDLSTTGFAALAGKNETAIGVEDKWSKYASIQSKYLIEDGANGTDTFAVIGLINRIPVQEHLSLDLGMERGQLVTGKDHSFDAGSVGFSWLPKKNFRASTRYEIRDLGGLGQIFTTGAAGRLTDGLTLLGRYQYSTAAFQPGSGAVDVLNPLATNSTLSQQANANQATAALAWRPKSDREGILFSYTLRDANLNNVANSTLPEHDNVSMLSTDGYYQATHRLEFYGKFAMSDRTYSYTGSPAVSTLTYLWQARAQQRISRRFDAAIEGRTIYQPDTGLNQWTVAAEGGFWVARDLRAGLGYSFRSASEVAADFLTNPVKQGVYFVLTSKLSNMFNLFDPGTCTCAVQAAPPPPPPPPAPKPVANIQISAITGAHDVCPNDDLRLMVTASGWLPEQTPAYQWYIDGTAVAGATGTSLMMPTVRGSGTRSVTVSVTAGGITKTSAPVSVMVKPILPPTIRFVVNPTEINYGDKVPLAATGTASECTVPAVITYTTSEGSITGNTFDSTGVAFDVSSTKPQTKVVHLTATATDRIGQTATAPGDITIRMMPKPRRLDDIVFVENDARVNNCGKRLLLEELTPMLRSDPGAKVILIGHRDTAEKPGKQDDPLDEQRVLNAAAVLSAGQGVCPQLDLSRIFVKSTGTEQASDTRPTLCGSSTGVRERAGQTVKESDTRAQFRRVEIWFVPSGAEMPTGITGLQQVPEKIKSVGCPK